MIEPLSGFLSAVRQTSPVIFLGLAIATGTILFVSDDIATALGVIELRKQHRGTLGSLFIISVSLVAAQVLWGIGKWTSHLFKSHQKRRTLRRVREQEKEQLHNLTPAEKAYLVPYMLAQMNSINFRTDDGVATGLELKGIIYRPSTYGSKLSGFAFNLQPWAREYLHENPRLLEGANPELSDPPPMSG